jgi:hypothetical protein
VLHQQQPAEEIRDCVLGGQGVTRDRRARLVFALVGPPFVTKTWSAPSTVMPCGPIAFSLVGVFAYEASPVAMRDWRPQRLIFVTAPVAPMHAGPSPPMKHGPLPPRPASATNRSPREPNARCRGLSSPDATTSTRPLVALADGASAITRSKAIGSEAHAWDLPGPG